MPANIQGLEFEIKGSTEGASKSLENLTSTLKELKGALGNGFKTSGIKKLANEMKKSSDETKSASKNVKEAAKASEEVGGKSEDAGEKVKKSGSAWKHLAQIVKNTSNTFKSFAQITSLTLTPFKAMGRGVVSIGKNIASFAGKFSKPFKKIGGTIMNVGKNIASFSGNLLTMPFRNAIKGATNFAKKLHSVAGAFKRIAFYRFIRTIIKEITQAFGEGINNLYAWSSAINGEFAQSMDSIATSMNYFKNSIGAMVAPLINALAPALDFIIDKLVDFLNVINQVFAKLTGADYWTKAKKVTTQYADNATDATSSVGKSAKEAMKYLAPFDELNVLPSETPTSTGGGGGAGAQAQSGESAFEYVNEFSKGVTTFTDQIKGAIEKSDWKGLGTTLGNKVNELVDKIPWATAGSKFGTGINGIVSTQYWTLKTINFTNIGNKISEFINNALDKIDFEVWGRLLVRKFTSALDLLAGLIMGLDSEKVAKAVGGLVNGAVSEAQEWIKSTDFDALGSKVGTLISDSLSSIDWANLGTTLSDGIKGAFDFITSAIESVDWHGLGEKVREFLVNIDWAGIANSMFEALGSALGGIASFVAGLIGDGFKNIKSYFDQSIEDAGGDVVAGIFNGIKNAISGIGSWIDEHVFQPFIKGFKKVFKIESPSKVMEEMGGYIIDGLKNGLKNIWGKVKERFSNFVKKTKEFFKDPIGTVKVAVDKGVEKAKEVWDGLQNSTAVKTLKETGSKAIDTVKKKIWEPIQNSTAVKQITGVVKNTFDTAKKAFNAVQSSVAEKGIIGTVKETFSNMKKKFDSVVSKDVDAKAHGSKDKSFNFFEAAGDWVKKAASKVVTAIGKGKQDSTFDFFTKSTSNWQNKAKDKTVTAIGKGKEDKSFDTGLKHYNELTSKEVTATIKGNIVPTSNTLTIAEIKANNVLYKNQRTGVWTPLTQAQGGVFSGGKWRPIEQYASGGITSAGQLFIAREAGPELVGTLGGHTAVMNNNQIVASVSAGVARAIAGIRFSLRGLSDPMAKASAIMAYQTEAIEQSIEMATSRLAPYMQDDESMEEKMYSAMMRALSEQEREPIENKIYLDGRVVYQDVVQQNNQNIMRTGVNPLAQRA